MHIHKICSSIRVLYHQHLHVSVTFLTIFRVYSTMSGVPQKFCNEIHLDLVHHKSSVNLILFLQCTSSSSSSDGGGSSTYSEVFHDGH
jgi:hypothetical protein